MICDPVDRFRSQIHFTDGVIGAYADADTTGLRCSDGLVSQTSTVETGPDGNPALVQGFSHVFAVHAFDVESDDPHLFFRMIRSIQDHQIHISHLPFQMADEPQLVGPDLLPSQPLDSFYGSAQTDESRRIQRSRFIALRPFLGLTQIPGSRPRSPFFQRM